MWRWTEIEVTLSLVLTAPRSKEWFMTFITVRCPHCQSEQIVKRGKTGCGTQRYLSQNTTCATGSFLLDYGSLGRLPEVKHRIIDIVQRQWRARYRTGAAMSTDTVLRELRKKEAALESVNTAFLRTHNSDDMAVAIERAGEDAEMDEMWSFVGNKGNPRWLWHAIEYHTGAVLAYVFGRRKDEVFLQLKALLEPLGSRVFIRILGGVRTPSRTRNA